ncbi:MAG: biosynthetic arginine decarboxylase [Puniceicoccaceae bacterium]
MNSSTISPPQLTEPTPTEWTVEDARRLYRTANWGADYFDIAEDGVVVIRPRGSDGPVIRIDSIVDGLKERGVTFPVLLRFGDILKTQIGFLCNSFAEAFKAYKYQGRYRGVYPVKVNQQEQVIDEITRIGRDFDYGLEAGSKPELIAALAYLQGEQDLLICNGYKDARFIELGLIARQLGIDCVFVIETMVELPVILETSARLGIEPSIGVRVRLSSGSSGHWKDSAGDRSVFGLNMAQVMKCADILREAGMLHCFRLLHFHLGSQIPDIRDIRTSLTEACRVYAGLVEEGATMGMLDIGGGLAIDYDGTHSQAGSSRNYSMSEYTHDVVEVVASVMDAHGLPHPDIVTEAGRATVGYYSILLFDVLDVVRFHSSIDPALLTNDLPDVVQSLVEVRRALSTERIQECYNDAIYYRDEIRTLFKAGTVNLRHRAVAEDLFWDILSSIHDLCRQMEEVPESLASLDKMLADIYYGNLSIFQSLPDAWAIDQLFPIMPVQRLNEEPTRQAVISDITCDCDGKLDSFIGEGKVAPTLPVHPVNDDEDYLLGVFLVGAYQETLGDLHNLFGDTSVVSICLDEGDDGFHFERELEGDSISEVLSYVEYDPKVISKRFRDTAEKAVRQGRITVAERRRIVAAFDDAMRGTPYYENHSIPK